VRVSSTRVREAVRRQDFREARMLLGRPYALHGPVVSGERRGRGLGFPTANLLPREECLPPPGVYAARAEVDGRRYLAAVNVGTNPTFSSDAPARTTVEAHLLDFSGDLYARTMRLEFVCPIRGEIAFASPDALVAQIGRDVEAVRQVLARGEAG
jgi:riboflavin kinase/FMN adenylyltransferase